MTTEAAEDLLSSSAGDTLKTPPTAHRARPAGRELPSWPSAWLPRPSASTSRPCPTGGRPPSQPLKADVTDTAGKKQDQYERESGSGGAPEVQS